MKSPVLSEIERQKRNELHAKQFQNEAAMLDAFVPCHVDLSEHKEFLAPFLEFCAKRVVRHCPARPATVATFLNECSHRGEEFIVRTARAIEALHNHHAFGNPVATRLVEEAINAIIGGQPPLAAPRAFSAEIKDCWSLTPRFIQAEIVRIERGREKWFRNAQNEIAKERKLNGGERKQTEPSGTVEVNPASAG